MNATDHPNLHPASVEPAHQPTRRGVIGWVAAVAGFLSLQAVFPAVADAAGGSPAAEGAVEVAPFQRLELDVPAQVRYETGATARVSIDAPARVRDGIRVRSTGGRLVVDTVGSWSADRPVRISIQGPADLAAATLAGASVIILVGLKGDAFELVAEGSSQAGIEAAQWRSLKVRISDSARVTGRGRADRLAVQVSDSGDWEGADFPADTVEVRTDDSARARIQGQRHIEAHAAGASSVVTAGPARVERHVQDAATIDGQG